MALTKITSHVLADNAVTSVKIAENAITARELATNAIVTLYIADNGVTSIKIAENNITAREIAQNIITVAHLADSAVETAKINADAITGAKIADDAIDSEHYADGSIDNAHIADDAIDSEHYAAGSIDTAHIADDQITLAKMAGLARGKLIYGNSSGNPTALATGTADQVLTHDGTDLAWQDSGGGGKILQVVHQQVTTMATTSGGSWNDSGMTLAITPSATSSTILIFVDGNFGSVNYGFMRLVRGSTVIGVGTDAAGRNAVSSGGMASAINSLYTASKQTVTWIDSPSTTSATTYKTQVVNNYHSQNTITRNSGSTNPGATYVGASVCTITLMELDGS